MVRGGLTSTTSGSEWNMLCMVACLLINCNCSRPFCIASCTLRESERDRFSTNVSLARRFAYIRKLYGIGWAERRIERYSDSAEGEDVIARDVLWRSSEFALS